MVGLRIANRSRSCILRSADMLIAIVDCDAWLGLRGRARRDCGLRAIADARIASEACDSWGMGLRMYGCADRDCGLRFVVYGLRRCGS
eukprot:11564507-Alexandrium_andersonii.AAC.1